MADIVMNKKTHLDCEEVIVRAVQFFSTENWQVTSQSGRAVTLKGKGRVPIGFLILTIIALVACVIPGIILYFCVIRQMQGFQNMVVTASPIQGGSEVSISHPKSSKKLADKFMMALPSMAP